MSNNQYDEIANILKEAQRRYGVDTFKDTRRLKGLLTDYIFDRMSEINIVLTAIDDGVPEELENGDPQGMDILINRICDKLEESRGIREDISRSAVMAIAYSMGLSDLPSTQIKSLGATSPNPASGGEAQDDWLGMSEAVGGNNAGNSAQGSGAAQQPTNNAMTWLKENQALLTVAVAVLSFVLYFLSGQNAPPPQPEGPFPQENVETVEDGDPLPEEGGGADPKPEPQPTPQPEPAPTPAPQPEPEPEPAPQPAPQPAPAPRPQPQPAPQPRPQPAPQPTPTPQPRPQPENEFVIDQNLYLADGIGVIWRISLGESAPDNGQFVFYANTPQGVLRLDTAATSEDEVAYIVSQNGVIVGEGGMVSQDDYHYAYRVLSIDGFVSEGVLHINHSPSH